MTFGGQIVLQAVDAGPNSRIRVSRSPAVRVVLEPVCYETLKERRRARDLPVDIHGQMEQLPSGRLPQAFEPRPVTEKGPLGPSITERPLW